MASAQRKVMLVDRNSALAICYGTRPQVIKASVLVDVLGRHDELLTIDTGQHYDYEMNQLLYEQLGVRRPDYCLEVGSADHAAQTSAILTRAAGVFEARRPRAVIVIGDTNSTLGCALAAAKLRIPVVHVEAGLRAADAMMAEEINRRVVDAISALLCAPSASAERQLVAEKMRGRVVQTGDLARDVLLRAIAHVPAKAASEPFIFSTLHRAELTDEPERLAMVLGAFNEIRMPIVLAAHPRTRPILERSGLLGRLGAHMMITPPQGYFETLRYVRDAHLVVTDSGGLQREAYWLGTPCVTLRNETEWLETLELGANVLLAAEQAPAELPRIVRARMERNGNGAAWPRDVYGTGDAAQRISAAIGEWL